MSESKDTIRTILGDRYQLDFMVARGGMGEIWHATDLQTEGAVAVKRAAPRTEQDVQQLTPRLLREAEVLAQIDHPNVVRHLNSGTDPRGLPYLVMEWLEGESLEERRRRGPFSLVESVDITRQILEALASCHQRQVIHRDIKPGNILLAEDQGRTVVKLIDFGLALFADQETRLTQEGDVLGTLNYLSPEQARGAESTTFATDIYSTGVVLYELITGRPPFRAEKPLAILLKIVTETPQRPSIYRPDLPPWLERVVLRAMRQEPADRFESAQVMSQALDRSLERVPPDAQTAVVNHGLADTDLPWMPSQREYRLVSLLCLQPARSREFPELLSEQIASTIGEGDGVVCRLRGGRVVGMFGLDRTTGDETLRAVQTGLTLRPQLEDSASMVVATLHLLCGSGRQLNGEDLDHAMALLAVTPFGEVAVDQASRELLRDQVKLRKVGKQHHLLALTGSSIKHRTVLGVETPTVGREQESAFLREAFEQAAREGSCRALLVAGPPGMGKSRILNDVLDDLRERSAFLIEARATPAKSNTPYTLVTDALSNMANLYHIDDSERRKRALADFVGRVALPERAEDIAVFLGEAAGVPFVPHATRWTDSMAIRYSALRVARSDPNVMRDRIANAVLGLMEDASREGVVTLVLEDLHWADSESLDLLVRILDQAGEIPLLVLCTARSEIFERDLELFDHPLLERLELPPLDHGALSRLLKAVLGSIDPDYQAKMLSWCAGNPYFVEELVSWMVARQLIIFGDAGWQLADDSMPLDLPLGIEGAIQGRLDRLRPEAKELLKGASVFGEIFWEQGCSAIGHTAVGATLKELERLELVARMPASIPGGAKRWTFRHEMAHQVAYRMLPIEERKKLHLLAACWLEQAGEDDSCLLAHHYQAGGDLVCAAGHQARAGERALMDGDLDRAISLLQSALEFTPESSGKATQAKLTIALTKALLLKGQHDRAQLHLERLDQLAQGDERLLAECSFHRGRLLLVRGQYTAAERALSAAIEALSTQGEVDLAFEAKHTLFWAVWVQGRYRDAGPLAERMHREASVARPDHLCSAKLASAFFNIACGDLAAALILAEQAAEHAREAEQPYREVDAMMALGSARELVGLYDAALDALGRAGAIIDRFDTGHHRTNLQICLGRVQLSRRMASAALSHFEQARELAEGLGDERTLAIALSYQARTLVRLAENDQLDEALTCAERALSLATGQSPPEEAEALLALSEVQLARAREPEAVTSALRATEILDQLGTHEQIEVEILLAAFQALAALGQQQRAETLLLRAQRALHTRADRISSSKLRQSFVHEVPHNRRVAHLASEIAAEADSGN